MDLNILWFLLIAILYIGFFILEGFDFGVGILLPVLGKGKNQAETDKKRRVIINTIGPHWDGNEVWLITAGGATFAAFPHWYATLFSGFYLPFVLLLLALIMRGVAFEFRSKDDNPHWRHLWDWAFFTGSLIPPLLLGVTFGNLARGVPIDANMHYVGGFFNLLNPFALLNGVAMVLTFALHGAIFLSLKTTDDLMEAAHTISRFLWLPVVLVLAVLFGSTFLSTDILENNGLVLALFPIAGAVAILAGGYFIRQQRKGWAFAMTAITIAFATMTVFAIMFPRVMISNIDPTFSLTIYNAASNPYTLRVISIITLIFLPIVLLYQGWSYWIFRKRIEAKPEALTY